MAMHFIELWALRLFLTFDTQEDTDDLTPARTRPPLLLALTGYAHDARTRQHAYMAAWHPRALHVQVQ